MRSFRGILLRLGLVSISLPLTSSLVIHERRDVPFNHNIYARSRIEKQVLLPMRIGLTQNKRASVNAEGWLMEVSDPNSPNYGMHWTSEEVLEVFKPSEDTIQNVTAWLRSHAIDEFTHSDNRMWFAFDISVEKAEDILRTEYFEHITPDGVEASCDYYHLPAHIQPHIDFITPGVQGRDITGRSSKSGLMKRSPDTVPYAEPDKTKRLSSGLPSSPPDPPTFQSLAHCDQQVTPACIRALYDFDVADPTLTVSPNNSMGIFEAEDNLYYQPDLDYFYSFFAENIPEGTAPIYKPIDGASPIPAKPISPYIKDISEETSLDLQIALPIIYPQNATVFNVGSSRSPTPLSWRNFYNRFLDAIDGSYCSYEQRNNSARGGRPQCGIFKPTNVISFSWGSPERVFTNRWQQRQCNEYLKLGLQGVSLFFCTQDYGVADLGWNREQDLCPENNGTGPAVFMPFFPASCPWVTAVGATHIADNNTVFQPEKGARYSGGGFSLNFEAPTYQKDTLSSFFANHNPPWSYFYNGNYRNQTGRYNRNGRGFPDISAVGTQIATIANEYYQTLYGTSASTPLVAALFNRIIEERIRAGKGPLGFINPTLYKNPEAVNDIVGGNNGWCVRDGGFTGVPGWDPVTGLGTPNYPKLLDVFMKLP